MNESKRDPHGPVRLCAAMIAAALALAAPTWNCGTSEDLYDESDLTPAERCKKDCDLIYSCGYALPDGETGLPLALTACRSGCDDEPGNVECLDQCREDHEFNETSCDDVGACVQDLCAIPLAGG